MYIRIFYVRTRFFEKKEQFCVLYKRNFDASNMNIYGTFFIFFTKATYCSFYTKLCKHRMSGSTCEKKINFSI
jgi:hypothetical protein